MPVVTSVDQIRAHRAENDRLRKLEADRKAAADRDATAARNAQFNESLRRIQNPTLAERMQDAMDAAMPAVQQKVAEALEACRNKPMQQNSQDAPPTAAQIATMSPTQLIETGLRQDRQPATPSAALSAHQNFEQALKADRTAQQPASKGEFKLPENWRSLPASEQIRLGMEQDRHNSGR